MYHALFPPPQPLDFDDFGSSMLKVDRPIVQDPSGNKRLSLRFDCKDFKPEEITVKTVDNRLMVQVCVCVCV